MPRPCNLQIDRQPPESPIVFFLTQALPTASLLTLLAFGFLLLTFSL
jgi:hypothetical protein